MKIIKKSNRDFTIIDNRVFSIKELSIKAKLIYLFLLSRPDNWEFFCRELAKHFKESYNTILSAMKELEKYGLLVRVRKKSKGKLLNYDFYIYDIDSLNNQKSLASVKSETQNKNCDGDDIAKNQEKNQLQFFNLEKSNYINNNITNKEKEKNIKKEKEVKDISVNHLKNKSDNTIEKNKTTIKNSNSTFKNDFKARQQTKTIKMIKDIKKSILHTKKLLNDFKSKVQYVIKNKNNFDKLIDSYIEKNVFKYWDIDFISIYKYVNDVFIEKNKSFAISIAEQTTKKELSEQQLNSLLVLLYQYKNGF